MGKPKLTAVLMDKGELPMALHAEVDAVSFAPYGMVSITWISERCVFMQPAIARLVGQYLIDVADKAEAAGKKL
jgi:hypothetical protein